MALGITHVLLLLAMTQVNVREQGDNTELLFTLPLAVMLLATMAWAVLFAGPRTLYTAVSTSMAGICHGLAHIALAILGTWAWQQFPFIDWPSPLDVVAAPVLYGPIAGFFATQLFAAYLYSASSFGVNYNELFSGQGEEVARSFLRMRIDANGVLAINAIAVDRVCESWQARPDQPPHVPWIHPREPIQVRYIEPPVNIH
jgi:hypothetical protein